MFFKMYLKYLGCLVCTSWQEGNGKSSSGGKWVTLCYLKYLSMHTVTFEQKPFSRIVQNLEKHDFLHLFSI